MIKKLIDYIKGHIVAIILLAIVLICLFAIESMIDVTRKAPEIVVNKGGVQNHLVWAANGTCFFVRPYTNDTVYLIPVEDCNKK